LNSILVIRGGAIGDFILTLPALKALRDAYPNARIEILGYKHIAELAENRFYAQRVRSIESAALARFFAKAPELPPGLAKYFAGFDLIISYLYDPDSIFETNLRRSGAKKVIRGPAKIDPPKSASRTDSSGGEDGFAVANNRSPATHQLAQPITELGLTISDFAPKVFPSDEDRHQAKTFLAGLTTPIVAVHPGSGSDRKNWPLPNWIALGNDFLANSKGSLVIVSGEADQLQVRQLESIWLNSRVRFAKNLPLTELAALLGNTIFVGHDSGISHLAAAGGADCILLFGPTDPAIWAPLNENAQVIRAADGDLRRLDVDPVRAVLDQELMRIGIST